jgi:hypothetical protein
VVINHDQQHSMVLSSDFLVLINISVHRSTNSDAHRSARFLLALKIRSLSDMDDADVIIRVRVGV